MLGQILEIAKEGQILQSSFQKIGDSEEVFSSTIEKLALEIKKRSSELHHLANQALGNHESIIGKILSGSDSGSSCAIGRDPIERRGINFSPQQKELLIFKGPFQPVLDKFRINKAISKGKQNSFSENWYKDFPFLEYSPSIDRAFCFACSLFGENSDRSESNWVIEGVNRWDKNEEPWTEEER